MSVEVAHRLDGVREKLARADRHAEDLGKTIAGFVEKSLYVAEIEQYAQEQEGLGYFTVRAREFEPHPINMVGVVIGDIVHNLRSALDHIAWQLAILAGNDPPPDGTAFPVFWEESKFVDRGRSKIRGLTNEDRAVIESQQPFHASDPKADPLWVLHELANIDKHRVCPVTLSVVRWAVYLEPVFSDCEVIRDEHVPGPHEDGSVIARFHVRKTGLQPKIETDFRFTYTAKWDEDGPGRGVGVFRGIEAMRSRVGEIANSFEPRFS